MFQVLDRSVEHYVLAQPPSPPPQQNCADPILLLCIRPRQGDFFGEKMQNQQKCANSSKSAKMCLGHDVHHSDVE